MNKLDILKEFIAKLTVERETLASAVQSAHEATTHAESKAEDSHDTRAIEASYLTAGQSKRLTELDRLHVLLQQLLKLSTESLSPHMNIQKGSLIEIECDGKKSCYLFAPEGGGFSIQSDGRSIQILTPSSILGEALEGLKPQDIAEVEIQSKLKNYRVIHLE